MFWGWAREVIKNKKIQDRIVIYRAPCGRRLRNMDEVHQYLRLTDSQLGVDLFSFDCRVQCFKEFEPEVTDTSINGNPSLRCFKQFIFINFVTSRHHEWRRERSSFFCQLN